MQHVLLYIKKHKQHVDYYLNGNCYEFSLMLKTHWPQARSYYDMDHIITEIDGVYYDVTGQVEKGEHIPLDEYSESVRKKIMKIYYSPKK